MSDRVVGAVLVVISATSFGAMAIFGVWAQQDGVDTATVLFVRFALAAVILLAIAAALRLSVPGIRTVAAVAAMGGIGYVGQSYCFFLALEHADASLVALLLYLYPALVAILAVMFLHEPINLTSGLALTIVLLGTAMVVGGGSGEVVGITLGVAAAAIYSIYILVGAVATRGQHPLMVATIVCCVAAIVCGVIVAVRMVSGLSDSLPASERGWLSLASIAVICTVVAILTFFAGLQRLGATSASVMSTLEPVVTVLLAMWLLGESLSVFQAVGGALILVAVICLALARDHRTPEVSTTPV